MKGCVRAEFYKLSFNKLFYVSALIVVCISIVCAWCVSREERPALQTYYFSFVFLLLSVLMVGSIFSNEYQTAMKETVIAVQSRTAVYFSKVFVILISMSALFAVYIPAVMLLKDSLAVRLLLNQYVAVIQQTILLTCLAVLVKSFSALAVADVVLLCVYREVPYRGGGSAAAHILDSTYYNQFVVANHISVYPASLIIMAACLVLGFLAFRYQDING